MDYLGEAIWTSGRLVVSDAVFILHVPESNIEGGFDGFICFISRTSYFGTDE